MSSMGFLSSPSPVMTRNGAYSSSSPLDANRSRVVAPPQPHQQHQHHHVQHHQNPLAASSSSSVVTATPSHVNALKCPELLLRGIELQQKVSLEVLEKKGKRFESPWNKYFVAVYAGVLFYYDDLKELPRGVVPLAGSVVKAVDRIFKNSEHSAEMEASASNCGPCFKVTSSAHRVLLFRCPSDAVRTAWVQQIQRVNLSASTMAMAMTTTSSMSSSSTSSSWTQTSGSSSSHGAAAAVVETSSTELVTLQPLLFTSRSMTRSPSSRFSLDETQIRRHGRRTPRTSMGSTSSEDAVAQEPEISQMLREAMALVSKQKKEINELRKALEDARAIVIPVPRSQTVEEVEAGARVEAVDVGQGSDSASIDTDEPEPRASEETAARSSTEGCVALGALQPPSSGVSADVNDSLQKQAMELAEIARYLQMTFQSDVLGSMKQINSVNSTAPTEMMDHLSSTSSNYSDRRSEDDQDNDSETERLSEFVAGDEKFLESSGMLDSIQKVMRDFMSPSNAPRTKTQDFIINDDVIAEIHEGVAADKKRDALHLMDTNTLRALRSRSSGDGNSEYRYSLSPELSARPQPGRTLSDSEFSLNDRSHGHRNRPRPPKALGVLVIEDNMAVVSCILQTASRDEKTALLLPLLRLFNRHNRLSRLIRWAIESEVASVMNVATLFRSDDYASRLVSTYSKSVGANFIKVILTKPIREICKLKLADVNLTPQLTDDAAGPPQHNASVQRNADNLMDACQRILDSIIANKDSIPSSYFHICSHLNAKVINRFDGSMEGLALEDPASLTRSVIGGFLFLRFVCPAITTPHLHDLVDKQPAPETRKILVLITKLLFKTATSVLFNEKEAHLRILNPFIERNSLAIQKLFVDLSIAPAESIDDCFASDSYNMFTDLSADQPDLDLTVIRTIAEKNFAEIDKKLSVSGCSPVTIENLRGALAAAAGAKTGEKAQRGKKLNMKFLSSFHKIVRKHSDV